MSYLMRAAAAILADGRQEDTATTRSGTFFPTADHLLYEDKYVMIRWNNGTKQPQYYPKSTAPGGWGWHDAAIWMTKGNSSTFKKRSDDISSATDQWFYFTSGGNHDAEYNAGFWGSQFKCALTKESDPSNTFPGYKLDLMVGDPSGKVVWDLRVIKESGVKDL